MWKRRRLKGFDYSDPDHAYFVTIRALSGTAPFTDDRLAQKVIASLEWLRSHRGIAIYALCLMPDHLHLLMRLSPNGPTLGVLLGAFKRFTTRQSWPLGYKGALWQKNYHDHILRRSEHGKKVASYILTNPERKGLVLEGSEHPYSGCPDPM
jgi:REP element-mobilizing transposase RayT